MTYRRVREGRRGYAPERHLGRSGLILMMMIAAASQLSCGASAERALKAINAGTLAEGFITEQLEEEGTLQATCQELRTKPTEHDKALLCRALFCPEGQPCPCGPGADLLRVLREQQPAQANAELVSVIGASLPIKIDAHSLGGAPVVDELRKGERAFGAIAARINIAKAGLLVVLRLSDQAQKAADYIASSIPYVGALAKPVLSRAASAIVAAALDEVLTRVEDTYGLPRADFSKEACALYDRDAARSDVADYVLRRAILRYADKRHQVMRGAAQDCKALAIERPPGEEGGAPRSACIEMAAKVTGSAPEQDPKRALKMLFVEPPKADKTSEAALAAQARWIHTSARKCIEDEPSSSRDQCTLDRVLPVAGYLYGITMDPKGAPDVSSVRFSEIERSLAAIEAELSGIHRDLAAVDERLAACEAGFSNNMLRAYDAALARLDERLKIYMASSTDKDRKIASLSADLRAREAALSRIEDACAKPYAEAALARRKLAEALGLDVACGERAAAPGARRASKKFPFLSVEQASFCEVDRPIVLRAEHLFRDCETAVSCAGDASFCAMAEALGKVTGRLPTDGDDRKKPLFLQGHASTRPVDGGECFERAKASFDPLFRSKGLINAPKRWEPFNLALSHQRAESAAKLLVRALGDDGADFHAYATLEHAGSGGADRECATARGESELKKCFDAWQRVDVTIRLEQRPFVFHEPDCLARLGAGAR